MKKLGTITLETNKLILRKFMLDDAEAMYNNWATDPAVCKYVTWNVHKNIDETKEIIKNWIEEYETGNYNWVVELKETKEILGSISVVHLKEKNSTAEVGYCYGSKYWGNGYATEALKRVIEFLLNDCELHLIECKHMRLNPASGRVMEKAGMKKDAILPQRVYDKYTDTYDDLIVYSITKKD